MKSIIPILLVATTAAAAQSRDPAQQKAINALGARLTLSWHCAALTGDRAPYEAAKQVAPRILAEAGVTSPSADEMIAAVEQQSGSKAPNLSRKMCTDLLGEKR